MSSTHSTHRTREIAPEVKLETYHPPGTYETFGEGVDHPLREQAGVTPKEASVAFIESRLGASAVYDRGYATDIVTHAYVKQTHDGIPFANAVANVTFNKADKVVAFGSSFVSPSSIAPSTPTVSIEAAIATAEAALGGTHTGHPATLQYLTMPDGSAALVHVVQVQNDEKGTSYEAFVDAHANVLVSVTDFVAA
ncbi:hypothetical protein B0H15DRAFT_464602 [Mycena belliarum]|uniref:FTP domain-containing protein n=1 Tax=Mycena belliarum TaxID=1033014 RepID=A0AAD6UHX3_9AGAR|nr:hypothetical protein B0H15DRAFT_464602 [Mycena belliae]